MALVGIHDRPRRRRRSETARSRSSNEKFSCDSNRVARVGSVVPFSVAKLADLHYYFRFGGRLHGAWVLFLWRIRSGQIDLLTSRSAYIYIYIYMCSMCVMFVQYAHGMCSVWALCAQRTCIACAACMHCVQCIRVSQLALHGTQGFGWELVFVLFCVVLAF